MNRMRLIDADKMLEKLSCFNEKSFLGLEIAKEVIKNQPTAFDKEKVISQIQEKSYWESWSKVIDTNKAVWIVEKGGIDG